MNDIFFTECCGLLIASGNAVCSAEHIGWGHVLTSANIIKYDDSIVIRIDTINECIDNTFSEFHIIQVTLAFG